MVKKLLSLFLTFAKIGSITFGGGLTMLPLLTREIVEQIMIMQRDTGLRISNVVFMGQGEPLLNLDNVIDKEKLFTDKPMRDINFQVMKVFNKLI